MCSCYCCLLHFSFRMLNGKPEEVDPQLSPLETADPALWSYNIVMMTTKHVRQEALPATTGTHPVLAPQGPDTLRSHHKARALGESTHIHHLASTNLQSPHPFDFNISPKFASYINLLIFFCLSTYYTFHHFLTYEKLAHRFYFINFKIFQPYTIMHYYMCSELINSFNYSSLLATCFHYQAFLNIYSILILTNYHAMDTLGTLHPSPIFTHLDWLHYLDWQLNSGNLHI